MLDEMRLKGVSPDANSYACSFQTRKNLKAQERGQEIHSKAAKEGVKNDYSISNNLVDMYMGCGLGKEAEKVLTV